MLIIGILVFIIIFIKVKKVKVKWYTFFKKGFKPKRGMFGVYCYCGKQGQGKTYSVVEYLQRHTDLPIYSNISTVQGIPYTYFNGFDELLKLRDKTDCVIVYDEIFTALTKSSRMNTDVLDFLSQMRKRRIIFLTTAQEWLEINITLRRYCRYQINCFMRNFGLFGLVIKTFYDAEQMKWSQLDNEYIAPLLEFSISKCNIDVADAYDTFEQIKT